MLMPLTSVRGIYLRSDFLKQEITTQVYDNADYKGVDDIDCKLIFMATQNGEKLTIDRYGHVYDSSNRWIADSMKR